MRQSRSPNRTCSTVTQSWESWRTFTAPWKHLKSSHRDSSWELPFFSTRPIKSSTTGIKSFYSSIQINSRSKTAHKKEPDPATVEYLRKGLKREYELYDFIKKIFYEKIENFKERDLWGPDEQITNSSWADKPFFTHLYISQINCRYLYLTRFGQIINLFLLNFFILFLEQFNISSSFFECRREFFFLDAKKSTEHLTISNPIIFLMKFKPYSMSLDLTVINYFRPTRSAFLPPPKNIFRAQLSTFFTISSRVGGGSGR